MKTVPGSLGIVTTSVPFPLPNIPLGAAADKFLQFSGFKPRPKATKQFKTYDVNPKRKIVLDDPGGPE